MTDSIFEIDAHLKKMKIIVGQTSLEWSSVRNSITYKDLVSLAFILDTMRMPIGGYDYEWCLLSLFDGSKRIVEGEMWRSIKPRRGMSLENKVKYVKFSREFEEYSKRVYQVTTREVIKYTKSIEEE